ncbi:MAG: TrmH family RNA methyltransferase [Candidatus Oleimicrobiaceae bacterium]
MELIEGRICVEAALAARERQIRLIVIRQGLHPQRLTGLLRMAEERGVPVKFASAEEINAMARGKTHGGVVALAGPKPGLPLESLLQELRRKSCPALLLLEGVDDSQNLGFVLRSAEALGMDAVLLKKHLWDYDSTAVSRASSGAFERLPLVRLEQVDQELPRLKRLGCALWGCVAGARRTIYELDLRRPVIVAIGGEKRGLSAALRRQCDGLARIPMVSPVGSLALSQAAAVVMAEVMRQRLLSAPGLAVAESKT